jgi:hypothetical protein
VITKKSTLFDYIEREKVIKRVTKLCDITRQEAEKLGESFLFSIRECNIKLCKLLIFQHFKINRLLNSKIQTSFIKM